MSERKWLYRLALIGALALVAAACRAAPEAGAECPDTEFDCVEVGADEPIKIGSLLVISGPNAALGTDSQRGVEIAIDDRGQVLGHDIQLVAQDDGCSAEGGQTGAQALVSDPAIVAVVGTSCSSSAFGVADTILGDRGIALISPSNTAPGLTAEETHNEFYLRTAHNDKIQGAVVAEFLQSELGLETLATIHDGSPYAEQLQQVAADTFSGLGGSITKQEAINVGDTDFVPVLTDIAADKPDALYFPIFVAEGALITSQARTVPGLEDTVLIGSDGLVSPDFFSGVKEAGDGMYLSGPDVSVAGGAYEEFTTKYEDKYGEAPISAFHAHGYDAANMVFDAIEEVAVETDDGGLLIPRTQLKDALFATQGFQGITGTLSCSPTGDCQPSATISVNEITDAVKCADAYPSEGCSNVVFTLTKELEA